MKFNLGLKRKVIRWKRFCFHQDFIASGGGCVKRDHEEMQISCQWVHDGNFFSWSSTDNICWGLEDAIVYSYPWSTMCVSKVTCNASILLHGPRVYWVLVRVDYGDDYWDDDGDGDAEVEVEVDVEVK